MKSKLFDVNVYVIDGKVKVTFYKLIYSADLTGKVVQADTSETGQAGQVVINIHSTQQDEIEAIRYALDAEEYDNRPLNEWEEFDEWNTSNWFMGGDSPRIFREFWEALEEYEPELM